MMQPRRLQTPLVITTTCGSRFHPYAQPESGYLSFLTIGRAKTISTTGCTSIHPKWEQRQSMSLRLIRLRVNAKLFAHAELTTDELLAVLPHDNPRTLRVHSSSL
jgi:hypothetical protein